MTEKSLEKRVRHLDQRDAVYGPLKRLCSKSPIEIDCPFFRKEECMSDGGCFLDLEKEIRKVFK